ncbi:MAG: aminopeptidase [Chloroflexota bacterium]|nr:aminopeptidase [Chloroflexota bacterium]
MGDVISVRPDSQPPRALTDDESAMVDNVMRQCLAVGADDRVVVVTDPPRRPIGELFYAGALRHARDVTLLVMPVAERHGSEPPPDVAEAMRQATVCVLPTSMSLTHTRARTAATDAGARVASMPSITYEMAMRTLAADYSAVARASIELADVLSAAAEVTLTSPGGCDLTFSAQDRDAMADTGHFTSPGDMGNLPAGEAFIAPVEGTASGTVVIDAESMFPESPPNPPMRIRVQDGLAVAVDGPGAEQLETVFADLGDGARNVAELGIGTNPTARLSGNVLESEKVAGTAHVALGASLHIGGTVDVPFHLDGVIASPTIHVDGRVVIRDGRRVTPTR